MDHSPRGRKVLLAALAWAGLSSLSHASSKNSAPKTVPSLPAPVVTVSVPNVSVNLLPTGIPGGSAVVPSAIGAQLPEVRIPGVEPQSAERQQKIIAILSSRDGAQVPAEQQRGMAAELFGEGKAMAAQGESAVPGSESSAAPLAAAGSSAGGPQAPVPTPRFNAKRGAGLRGRAADWLTYKKLFYRSMYWYTVTHIQGMWPSYLKKIDAGRARGELPLSEHREFFAHMRVMGLTGRFYVLGYAPRDDNDVAREARETFAKYFTHPGVGQKERDAFNRFVDRARTYNAARRNKTNFRKHLRDALLATAVLPVGEIAAYYDARLKNDAKKQTDGFQASGGAATVLQGFRETVLETLAQEDKASKSRIVAANVLGSFAAGGPTMTSDFDVEAVSADGSNKDLKAFMTRLENNWRARALIIDGKPVSAHDQHPVTVHDNAIPPRRGVIDRIHYTDYLVVSHHPELVEDLQRAKGEPPPFTTSYRFGPLEKLGRFAQYAIVYLTTFQAELAAKLGNKSAAH